jgi:hypothetical protein
MNANAKTSEEYIMNACSYTLRDTALDWCHNYMLEFPNYIFSKFTHAFCKHHRKIQILWKNIHGVKEHEARGN